MFAGTDGFFPNTNWFHLHPSKFVYSNNSAGSCYSFLLAMSFSSPWQDDPNVRAAQLHDDASRHA